MLATNSEDHASSKIGVKPAGILLVTLSLTLGLAPNSPASPVVDVPPLAPALIAPSEAPTQIQEPQKLASTISVASDEMDAVDASPPPSPTAGPKVSDPGNVGYDALMAAALDSLPRFNRLGDDSGLSRFGRVPVNLDDVAGLMADSDDIAYAPVLIDFLRMQLYYEGSKSLSSYHADLVGDEASPDFQGQDEWKLGSEWLGDHF